MITTLAPWFGSNRMLASRVGEALEGCSWCGVLFAGGMSEIAHITARTLLINDLHCHVINLARIAADRQLGPKLYRRLRRLVFHPAQLEYSQMRCLDIERTASDMLSGDLIEWAENYFVCSWMGRSGVAGTDSEFQNKLSVRWNATGGDSAKRYRSAVSSLVAWRRILERATFTTLDVFEFLQHCQDKDGHGLYADPPFFGPGDAYTHKFSEEDHRRLAKTLASFNRARVVCRFYDAPLVRELYPTTQWQWNRLEGRKQTNATAPEVLLIRGIGT